MTIKSHHLTRLLDHSRPLYARRELKEGDVVLMAGDRIDAEALGWERPTIEALFRIRYIGHEDILGLDAPKVEPEPESDEDDGVDDEALPLTKPDGNELSDAELEALTAPGR